MLDISRAHFHPKSRRELYIGLSTEDGRPDVEEVLRTLYVTRDAANVWDEFFNNAAID